MKYTEFSLELRFAEVKQWLFRKSGSMDLHLSGIQLEKFSPLGQVRWTLPGIDWKGKEEEREGGNEKGCRAINDGEGE